MIDNETTLCSPSMLLPEPVRLPEKYAEDIKAFLVDYWHNQQWRLSNLLGFTRIAPLTPTDLLRTFLAEKLALIARFAAGEDMGEDFYISYVTDSIQAVTEMLFAPIAGLFVIPDDFWETPVGAMILTALIRAEGDELITLSEAAEISGRSLSTLSGMISRGTLKGYPDPNEPNPRKRMRVRRSEVEALPPKRK